MNEFEMMVNMFKRVGDDLKITLWEFLNEQLLENETTKTVYWFKDFKLVSDEKEY